MGSDERTDWESDIKVIKPFSKNYGLKSRFIWRDKNSA